MNTNKKHALSALGLCFIVFTIPSCDKSTEPEIPNCQLVWQDEFDGPQGQKPDSTKWAYDIGTDWGNAQLEYDTDRSKNVSLDGNGNLLITADRESIPVSRLLLQE